MSKNKSNEPSCFGEFDCSEEQRANCSQKDDCATRKAQIERFARTKWEYYKQDHPTLFRSGGRPEWSERDDF